MKINKEYNSKTGNYEFKTFDVVHSMVGGSLTQKGDIFTYHDGQTPPTESEIDTKLTELVNDWNAQEYARDRTTAYPSTGDQLDYIYHNGVAKWKTDMIDPVKTKYPKG